MAWPPGSPGCTGRSRTAASDPWRSLDCRFSDSWGLGWGLGTCTKFPGEADTKSMFKEKRGNQLIAATSDPSAQPRVHTLRTGRRWAT